MPILADAYSDAHLNLDTLDRDISQAIQRVERAAAEFERALTISVEIDMASADVALRNLERRVRQTRAAIESDDAQFDIDANTNGILADFAAIESLKQEIADDIVITVRVDSAQALSELAAIEAASLQVPRDISFIQERPEELQPTPQIPSLPDVTDSDSLRDAIATVNEELDNLEQTRTISFDVDDLVTVLLQLEQLNREIPLLEETINLSVDVDDQAFAELTTLQGRKELLEQAVTFAADADIAAAVSQLQILQGVKTEAEQPIVIPTDIDIDRTLTDAKNQLKRFSKVEASLSLDTDTDRVARTTSVLVAEINTILGRIKDIEPQIDDIGVLANALQLKAELEAILRKVEVKVDLDRPLTQRISPFIQGFQSVIGNAGTGLISKFTEAFSTLGEVVSGLGKGVQSIFSSISLQGVDQLTKLGEGFGQISQSFQKLSGVAGPVVQVIVTIGSIALIAGAIYAVVNAIAALVALIVALVAYLVPLATGLVAAAAGFAAVTIAATGAVAALGFLVFAAEDAQESVKTLFGNFQNTIKPALEPIKRLLIDEFAPALFASLTGVVQRLAPFFEQAFGPLLNAVLPFLDILGQIGGPIAVAVGNGLTQLATTFNQFFTVLTTNSDALNNTFSGIEAFFNVLDALLRIVGEAGFAFAPFLNDLLNGFASLTNASIDPFVEIITVFGRALPDLGASLSNILTPIGELAVVVGRGIAAFAPFYDELFKLIQLLIPGLNFEALGVAIDRLTPAFAGLFERLGPVLEQATQDFVTFTERVLTPQTIGTLIKLIEGSIGTIAQIFAFLADYAPIITAFIDSWLRGFGVLQASLGSNLLFVTSIVANISRIVAGVLRLIGELVGAAAGIINAIPSQFRFGLDAEALQGVADGANTAADGIEGFGTGLNDIGRQMVVAGTETALFGGSLDNLGNSADGSKDNLDDYKITVETVAGAITLVGPAARQAEENLKRLNKQFPATISLLDKASEGLKSANIFKKAVEDQRKANDEQRRATEESARLAQESVQRTFAGGRLSEFFQEQADEVNDGVKSVGEAAREAARESLGLGRLSQFIRNEAVELDRAFFDFSENLRLRAANLRRIAAIERAGFRNLAIQLATLGDDPQFQARFLDELQARGTSALADFNGAIGASQQELQRTVAGLDPAIAEAAGFGAAPESERAIEKQGVTVFQALDRLNNDIQIRIRNAQRLGQLQRSGFSPLALQLSTLAGDPKELEQSLNELFAAGSGAISSANARFAASNSALAATAAQLDPLLAEALGLDQTKAAIEEEKFDIFGALDTFQKEQQLRLDNIKRIAQIEQIAPDVALGLAEAFGDDQEQLDQVLDSYFAAPVEKQGLFIAAWQSKSTEAQTELEKLDPRLAATLSASGQLDMASEEYWRRFGVSFQQGFEAAANASTVADTFFERFGIGRQPAGANPAQQQIIDEANKLGDTFTSTLTDAMKADLSAAGQQSAASFLQGLQSGLLGVGENGTSIVELILFVNQQGALLGEGIANGFVPFGERAANGFYDSLLETLRVLVSLEGTTGVAVSTASSIGAGFGESMAAGLNVAAAESIDLSIVFSTLRDTSFLIGYGAAQAFGTGFTTAYATVSIDVAAQIGTSLQGINTGITQVLGEGGRSAGDALAKSMVAGINSPAILQQLRTAVFFFVAEAQITIRDSGPDIGREFINGIDAGVNETAPTLLTTIGNIARLIAAAMEQALDINSPSGVGMTIGNQFIQGIVVGLQAATGELNTVAAGVRSTLVGALAEPVDINTAVVGAPTLTNFGVAAPAAAVVASPAGPVSDTLLLQQMLTELQAQNAELRAVAARPLIGEYNVATTREPQSPDQLAQDAAFAKALLL
jgi:hypothetical protein